MEQSEVGDRRSQQRRKGNKFYSPTKESWWTRNVCNRLLRKTVFLKRPQFNYKDRDLIFRRVSISRLTKNSLLHWD